MTDQSHPVEDPVSAGPFGPWLDDLQGALRGEHDADVPCGGCTACCTSSQFVHVSPHETETLRHIPPELLFPAPGLPKGHMVMGYDEHGHCPMLVEGTCSIYDHRPTTCRTYDCRVFPASGIRPEPTQPLVVRQASRWAFVHHGREDRVRHEAVTAAAVFLHDRADAFTDGELPVHATQRAVLAVEIHPTFLHQDPATGAPVVAIPEVQVVVAAVRRSGLRRQ